MGGLALVLGEPRYAAPPVQVIPVALARRPRREVAQCQQLRTCAPVELVALAVPPGVFYPRIEAVESASLHDLCSGRIQCKIS